MILPPDEVSGEEACCHSELSTGHWSPLEVEHRNQSPVEISAGICGLSSCVDLFSWWGVRRGWLREPWLAFYRCKVSWSGWWREGITVLQFNVVDRMVLRAGWQGSVVGGALALTCGSDRAHLLKTRSLVEAGKQDREGEEWCAHACLLQFMEPLVTLLVVGMFQA